MGYLHNEMVLTMDEMKDISGLSEDMIRKLIRLKKIAVLPFGGNIRASRKSFYAWMEEEFAKSMYKNSEKAD